MLKRRLRKVRRFMEENCLARINQGRVFHASEEAIEDWYEINNAVHDILKASLSPLSSPLSQYPSEDIPQE